MRVEFREEEEKGRGKGRLEEGAPSRESDIRSGEGERGCKR